LWWSYEAKCSVLWWSSTAKWAFKRLKLKTYYFSFQTTQVYLFLNPSHGLFHGKERNKKNKSKDVIAVGTSWQNIAIKFNPNILQHYSLRPFRIFPIRNIFYQGKSTDDYLRDWSQGIHLPRLSWSEPHNMTW
jgi:hypothetical protein